MTTFRKGGRVVPSGEGRTARWPKTPGTVTRKIAASTWEVIWDGTSFGDEMNLVEIAAQASGRRRLNAVRAAGDLVKAAVEAEEAWFAGDLTREEPCPTDVAHAMDVAEGVNLDALLGAERLDGTFAGIRLYDATDRNGRPIKVTIPENDND